MASALVANLASPARARAESVQPTRAEPASSPHVKVLDWNGHRAALTLTFDDGSPSQATDVLPVLDAKGVKATFFVTAKNVRKADVARWARAELEGHELANHTVDHCSAAALGKGGCRSAVEEIDGANRFIESRLGARDVYTFAYPFVDGSPPYERVASRRFLLARAGSGGLEDATTTPDWYEMDARFIEPSHGETVQDWMGWTDEAEAESKWLVLVFHSMLPENWCEGISSEDLATLLDHAKQVPDLWIDTFVNVGAYLRAERLFESLTPSPRGETLTWKWVLPEHFPRGRSLRVTVDSGTLWQHGVPLLRDAAGAYSVSLDAGFLTWSPKAEERPHPPIAHAHRHGTPPG